MGTDRRDVIELVCGDGSGRLKIAPQRGFNAFAWDVEWRGRTIPVLWSEPLFPGEGTRSTGSGIPILFPFAGRIGGARFSWRGTTYQLPDGDGQGNAIHGAVCDRAWEIVEQEPDRVTGCFVASRQWPEWSTQWPADFRLECTYTLRPWRLEVRFTVSNLSPAALPCGLGIHPYFAVDLDGEAARLHLPAHRRWELEGLVPTGHWDDWHEPPGGIALAETRLDDVVSSWEPTADGWQEVVLQRAADAPDVTIRFRGADFPFGVVYTAPHRRAVCFEPYSMLPNAFALAGEGIETGLWVLEPGASRGVSISIGVGDDTSGDSS